MKPYVVTDLEVAEGLERAVEATDALYRRITDAMGPDIATPVDHALCAGVVFGAHQALSAAFNSLVRRMNEIAAEGPADGPADGQGEEVGS